jgi:hypothetical protein
MAETEPKIPPEVIQKPKFKAIEGGKIKKEEPKKVFSVGLPPRRLSLKIGASVAGFFMGTAGVGAGLGEADKLPEPLQEEYNQAFHKDRIAYEEDGTPVVDITETTQAPETITVQAPETITVPTTPEVPVTQEEIKKFEGLNIELISDPSLSKLEFKRGPQIFTPKEVVYADQFEGPKKLENALMITWALTLKEREKHPAFENIDNKDPEALVTTLKDLLDQGETPTFTLHLKNDWSQTAVEDGTVKTETYKVDMTKGVKLVFVGEVTNLLKNRNSFVDSRDFIILQHDCDADAPVAALRYEVAEDHSLTIKLFGAFPSDNSFSSSIANSLQRIILNETYRSIEQWEANRIIYDNLFDGNQWDENDWIEVGEPLIVRNGDYKQIED